MDFTPRNGVWQLDVEVEPCNAPTVASLGLLRQADLASYETGSDDDVQPTPRGNMKQVRFDAASDKKSGFSGSAVARKARGRTLEPVAGEDATPPEARLQRGLAAPAAPTVLEKEAHLASGHQPYRAWCAHCLRGRGRARSHLCGASSRVTADAPVVHMDYAFFTASATVRPQSG